MVVGGCPVRIPDHASQVATMALDLLHQSGKFKLKHLPKTQLRLRIGLHTGLYYRLYYTLIMNNFNFLFQQTFLFEEK